jgi:hypothetical protein
VKFFWDAEGEAPEIQKRFSLNSIAHLHNSIADPHNSITHSSNSI